MMIPKKRDISGTAVLYIVIVNLVGANVVPLSRGWRSLSLRFWQPQTRRSSAAAAC
jgi:hypothetical protein